MSKVAGQRNATDKLTSVVRGNRFTVFGYIGAF